MVLREPMPEYGRMGPRRNHRECLPQMNASSIPCILFSLGAVALCVGCGWACWRIGYEKGHEDVYTLGEQAGADHQWLRDNSPDWRRAERFPNNH